MDISKTIENIKIRSNNFVPITLYLLTFVAIFLQIREVIHTYFYYQTISTYNPYLYSLYILFPTLGYITALSSSLIKIPDTKIRLLNFSYLCLAFIIFGMLTSFSNDMVWRFLVSENDKLQGIPTEFVTSAIRAATFYLPLLITTIVTGLYAKLYTDREAKIWIKGWSFTLYKPDAELMGPMTCEVTLCFDANTNKPVTTPESKRFEATLIQGATGTGKTSTLLLPMGCIDLEKKYFFRELAKEVGFRALQKGYAYIDAPLSNEELNKIFSLRLLKPLQGKEELFEKEIKDMIKLKDPNTGELTFRDLGAGAIDPDGEYVKNFRTIAKNFGIDCIIVDPVHEDSVGINPFIQQEPAKIASIISTVLKGMYESENPGDSNVFFAQVTQQSIENLSILLKVMYSRLNGGLVPTLEDMLHMLYNYEIVEQMCEEMKKDPQLAQEYKILIGYFEKNFYKPPLNDRGLPIPGTVGSGRRVTEQFLYGATTQLDNLLRQKDVKKVLCSRTNNIDFDDILASGKCLTVCSRRGPLGGLLSKAFGMFFILALQDAVLRRPGNEKNRIPFFLYIDEFPDFVNKETETCFTLFRKYRCAMIIAIQNLSQLERSTSMAFYKKVVLANTKTQLIFGDTNVEDSEYWADAFGKVGIWSMNSSMSGSEDAYGEGTGMSYIEDQVYRPFLIMYQGFKCIKYKTKNSKGETVIGDGKTNFVHKKYFEEHPVKLYDFNKYMVYSPYSSPDNSSGPQPDSISTSFSQVDAELEPITPCTIVEEPKSEIHISLGNNIQSDIKNDKISTEEMSALKELITEIHSDNEPLVDDLSIEIGTALAYPNQMPGIIDSNPVVDTQPIIDIDNHSVIDIEPLEEKTEKPNVLDKTGKIKIEVNRK